MVASKHALWDSGHDESVEVNQRALIDKVLARYSGEFTVFRELLQNSDDAQSKMVEIRFETESYINRKSNPTPDSSMDRNESNSDRQHLPDLRTAIVNQWTFRNNGILFRDEDWNRLKKIAEGNPDEEKIGAFGVGFYSLFSVTEEPFVTSGDKWMAFYWKDKKDQLYARRGDLPKTDLTDSTTWTTFEMLLREPAPIPIAFDFTRFLASSITFMTHLSEIRVYFDDKCLAKLNKSTGLPKELGIPRGLTVKSLSGIMTVTSVKSTAVNIQAEIMRWVYSSGTDKPKAQVLSKVIKQGQGHGGFFASLFSSIAGNATPQRSSAPLPKASTEIIDLSQVNVSSISLTVFSADISVRLDQKVSAELYRSTKKNPPTKMKYELIYTAKDEYDASKEEDKLNTYATGSIFQGLRADLDGAGSTRIFIGHATAQTTGMGGHMAARFIPTVERESIDFMDRNVAIWNKELLYAGGFLARCAYEVELETINERWDTSASQPERARLISCASHALNFFTFHASTPSADVSLLLESSFFACSWGNRFSVLSSHGVRDVADVRIPDPMFTGFLKQLPMLPTEIVDTAQSMVASLQSRGMIKEISFEDVLKELRSRPLQEGEMIACLKWWIGVYKQGDSSGLFHVRQKFLDAAVLVTKDSNGNEIIVSLHTIKFIFNPRSLSGSIPLHGPLPKTLLPVNISKALPYDGLASSLPWSELTITDWIGHLCNPVGTSGVEFDINLSASWSERVLNVVARSWQSLPMESRSGIIELLRTRTCIPTSGGMRVPDQSYFPNVNIFNDLPVVTFPDGTTLKGNMERLLQALGVRKHVELQVIFTRMIKTNEWTIADLTKYLVSVKSTLTAEEIARLKMTAAFPREATTPEEWSKTTPLVRCQAKDLYQPVDIFRQLQLPIIDWGKQTKWRSSSEEAKLLFELGLQKHPTLKVMIDLCANPKPEIRSVAFKYLLDNMTTLYTNYEPSDYSSVAFIPALKGSELRLGMPKEVFSNPEWTHLGFMVVHPSIHSDISKLKVREHPTTSQLLSLLQDSPPGSPHQARIWFTTLSGRVNDFSNSELKRLSEIPFVPLETEKGKVGPTVRFLPPTQCYLGGKLRDRFHSRLFVFVDFGTAANAFLAACGTRQEPSVEEVAKILLEDPHKFYDLAGGPTFYLTELRNIAVNSRLISSGTLARMKRSTILLGSQRKLRSSKVKNDADDYDDDEWDIVYDLKKPDQIIIADDTLAYQAFGDSLFTAPQEDILEAFYIELGSRRLSSLVKEEYQTSVEIKDSRIAAETRALILERLPLFLHEHTHARTKVSYNWLTSPTNFIVKVFGKVTVTKSFNFGESRLSRKQDASAVTKRTGSGPIQLWLAGNAQVDMYEVATSLNRHLFDSPKTNDALLFMTILSTDIRALKRRGYNVDRILKQQQAERQAAEELIAKNNNSQNTPNLPPTPGEQEKKKLLSSGNSQSEKIPFPETHGPTSPTAAVVNKLQSFKEKFGTFNTFQQQDRNGAIASQMKPKSLSPGVVTPLSNIASNIDMALKACRPESGNLVRNREEMRQVKESLNEGFCDISGRAGNLRVVGEMGGVKVFLSQETPQSDANTFMETKQNPLARFIHVMKPLATIYQLPLTSLHIFHDSEGGLIAFNSNGSIFLNLRYYESWHDDDVRNERLESAYISWYFTLAHEIAHNLVQPHNSEHEFYFSAICEKFIVQLGRLLPGTS